MIEFTNLSEAGKLLLEERRRSGIEMDALIPLLREKGLTFLDIAAIETGSKDYPISHLIAYAEVLDMALFVVDPMLT